MRPTKTTYSLLLILIFLSLQGICQESSWKLNLTDVSISSWIETNDFNESFFSSGLEKWTVNENYLTIESKGTSNDVYFDSQIVINKDTYIEIEYKVIELPTNADVRNEDTDDSCIKIYLAFGNQLWSETIALVHNEKPFNKTYVQAQGFFKSNLKYINMNLEDSNIISFKMNIYDMYKEIFQGSNIPYLQEIVIRSDSKDTNSSSKVKLKKLIISQSNE